MVNKTHLLTMDLVEEPVTTVVQEAIQMLELVVEVLDTVVQK